MNSTRALAALAGVVFFVAHNTVEPTLFQMLVGAGVNLTTDLAKPVLAAIFRTRPSLLWLGDPEVTQTLKDAMKIAIKRLDREAEYRFSRIDRVVLKGVFEDIQNQFEQLTNDVVTSTETSAADLAANAQLAVRERLGSYLSDEDPELVEFIQERFPRVLSQTFAQELEKNTAARHAIEMSLKRELLSSQLRVEDTSLSVLAELRTVAAKLTPESWEAVSRTALAQVSEDLRENARREADRVINEVIDKLTRNEILNEYIPVTSETIAKRIQRPSYFYQGSEPTWQDILEARDSKRSLQDKIMTMALSSGSHPTFILVTGAPGSGKSTLLRRVAIELYESGELVLFHRAGATVLTARLLERAYSIWNKRLYVLVDDFFRKVNAHGFLEELGDIDIPVVVIATSKSHEYEPTRANIEKYADPDDLVLGPLNASEFDGLVEKLHENNKLAVSQKAIPQLKQAFRHESQLLVLMARLTGGEELAVIVQRELKSLRAHPPLYDAYRYTCALYRVGVPIPLSILGKLLGSENIYADVVNRPEATGLLFADDRLHTVAIRARHEFVAELVAQHLWPHSKQLVGTYLSILSRIEPANTAERTIITSLLRSLVVYRMQSVAVDVMHGVESSALDSLLMNAAVDELLRDWAYVFNSLDLLDLREKCYHIAIERFPGDSRVHEEYARFLEQVGRMDEAEQQLRLAVDLDTSSIRAINSFAAFLADRRRFDEAENVIKEALQSTAGQPGEEYLLSTYARLLREQGRDAAAEEYYRSTVESKPDDPYARHTYARFLWVRGRFREALTQLETVLDVNPVETFSLNLYVNYCRHLKQYDKAITRVQQAIESSQDAVHARDLLISLYLEKGSPQDAADAASIAVLRHPRNATLRRRYVILLLDAGHEKAAREQLLVYLDLAEGNIDDYSLLIRLHKDLQSESELPVLLLRACQVWRKNLQTNEALPALPPALEVEERYLKEAADANPNDIIPRIFYARYLTAHERLPEAVMLLEEPCELDSDEALRYRAFFEILIGADPAKAETILATATTSWPSALWPHLLLLRLYRSQGREAELTQEGEYIGATFPAFLPARTALVDRLIQRGDIERAEELILGMLQDNPRNGAIRSKYVTLLLNDGRTNEAVQQLIEVVRINPDDVGSRLTLISLLKAKGDSTAAEYQIEFLRNQEAGIIALAKMHKQVHRLELQDKELLREALDKSPTDVELLDAYVRVLEKAGETDNAREAIERSMTVKIPPRASLRRLYATFLEAHGQSDKAEEQLKLALQEHPDKPGNYTGYALFLHRHGRQSEAQQFLADGANVVPLKFEAKRLTRWAGFHNISGNFDLADSDFRLALLADENDPVTHLNYALFVDSLGDRNSAEEHFKRAIQLKPDYVHARQAYALFLAEAGVTPGSQRISEDVARELNKALEVDPDNVAVLSAYGNLLASDKRTWNKAESYFQRALELDPRHIQSRISYAKLLRAWRRYTQAIKQLEPILSGTTSVHTVRHLYATILEEIALDLRQKGNYGQARDHFEQAEQQFTRAIIPDPTRRKERLHNAKVHNALAKLLDRTERFYDEIRYYFEQALEIEPDDKESRFHLLLTHKDFGEFLCRSGDFESARHEFEAAIAIEESNPYVRNAYARCLREYGFDEEAIEQSEVVLRHNPKQLHALGEAAKALCNLGRYGDAKVYFQKALDIDFFNPHIRIPYAHALLDEGLVDEAVVVIRVLEEIQGQSRAVRDLYARLSTVSPQHQ
jgi:tetratricopeptide (TPR) repeat protein